MAQTQLGTNAVQQISNNEIRPDGYKSYVLTRAGAVVQNLENQHFEQAAQLPAWKQTLERSPRIWGRPIF